MISVSVPITQPEGAVVVLVASVVRDQDVNVLLLVTRVGKSQWNCIVNDEVPPRLQLKCIVIERDTDRRWCKQAQDGKVGSTERSKSEIQVIVNDEGGLRLRKRCVVVIERDTNRRWLTSYA
jgi:hypothetical protein